MTFFTEIKCCKCAEDFGMAEATYQTLKRSSATFHCPFGHPQHFPAGQSEAEKLRLERDHLKQDAARLEDRIRQERDLREHAERRVSAAKGQVTRLKKRAAAGLCPCCNRSFTNLQRHMATKHAGFTVEEVQAEAGQTIQ